MNQSLSRNLQENLTHLQNMFGASIDLYTKPIQIMGISCCICMFEGLSSLDQMWIVLMSKLDQETSQNMEAQKLLEHIRKRTDLPVEKTSVETFDQLRGMLTAGMAVLLLDGTNQGVAFSSQRMYFRSIQEPSGEGDVRGSREGFSDLLRINISQVRRLVRAETLTVKTVVLGERTQTEAAILYDRSLVNSELVSKIEKRLKKVRIPVLFDTSYLAPFLNQDGFHFFSGVGYTERPVTASAKICEGKIIIMVNGSPFAMILPFFFSENFQSLDDYASKAYFASFIRVLKYISFFVAVILPGAFVSIVGYTPELLPPQLLHKVASAEAATPLPLFLEMVLVIILLEIIREAGLRLPKPVGHTVGLVAALIVGDTAVKTGILSTPVVIVSAITTVSMMVIPSLYEPGTVLRILFVAVGGIFGPFGILVLAFAMLVSICEMDPFGTPYTSPLSPVGPGILRDGILRFSWGKLAKHPFTVKDLSRRKSSDED